MKFGLFSSDLDWMQEGVLTHVRRLAIIRRFQAHVGSSDAKDASTHGRGNLRDIRLHAFPRAASCNTCDIHPSVQLLASWGVSGQQRQRIAVGDVDRER